MVADDPDCRTAGVGKTVATLYRICICQLTSSPELIGWSSEFFVAIADLLTL